MPPICALGRFVTKEIQPAIPFIDLVGDPNENFYQLGLKDAEAAKLALLHIESLIKTPWQSVDTGLRFMAEGLFRSTSSWSKRFSPWLSAYAEGVGVKPERLMLAYLVPELSACMSKLMPSLPKSLFACSSLFYRNNEGKLSHLRTLDFPLGGSFDKNERIVRQQFKDQPIIISCGSAGFPYPSLTAMTSEGVTFALHQKFNDVFDASGTPIFELVQDMLIRCGDLKTTLGFLRKSKSLTTWSLHMGFKDGQVLEADISGDQLHYKTYNINQQHFLYFNNELIKPAKNQADLPPLNFSKYNQLREESATRKLKKLETRQERDPSKILKQWCTLETNKKFSFDVLTPASLHVVDLVPENAKLCAIVGQAPKVWQGQIQVHHDLWQVQKTKITSQGKAIEQKPLDKAWKHLLLAQSASDLGDTHQLHHHLQMALKKSRGSQMETTIELFYAIFTFIHESHPKILSQLANDTASLVEKLPHFLQDHAWLLVSRIERILSTPSSIVPAQLHHQRHMRLLEVERAIPDALFGTVIRGLIYPRIELLDVIHLHERLDP